MKARSISSGRNFAMVGGLFALFECGLEHVRGTKDMKNAIVAGFSTGAVISARAGPTAMFLSGIGFAGFSIAIEILSPYLFDH
jgi:mitochondrial import inner membrane translocase subunit TIM22